MTSLRGVFTALVTPFKDGRVDFLSLERLVEFQLSKKIDGFVINGTTGESPTLRASEREEIFNAVKKLVPSDLPLIMGTGTNSTENSIFDSRAAERLGADALLVVVPYYNKPPQRGLLEHFKSIADSTELPVILYNVPGRTITALELDTILKLSQHPKIIGIKEASGNIEFAKQIRQRCGKEFILLSGDDGTYEQFRAVGGDGVISVASHVLPAQMVSGQISPYLDLINLLFCEANPIPVKMALHLMGILRTPECRLPLVTLSAALKEKLKTQMQKDELLP